MNARLQRRIDVGHHTCGRRMNDLGPWRRDEGQDRWQRGTWAATQEEADAEVAEFMAAHPTGSMGNVLWCYPGEQPRTCSFCGGAHPDDIIALIKAGWRSEPTDKGYKRYIEPPSNYPAPIPPVKLYVQHFSEEQIAAFNEAVRA